MSGIESWGISLILWLQSFRSPALDLIFRAITFLGEEKLVLLLLPLVYWCVDKRMGIRLAMLVMLSSTANAVLKCAFAWPRPPAELHLVDEHDYGFPSGHTQGATVAFGYLAYEARKWYAFLAAGVLILAVGLSRLYLGVHFPHDVLGGLVFGLLLLFAFVPATPTLENWWVRAIPVTRYLGAVLIPLFLLMIFPLNDAAHSLGALAGFALGELIELANVGFAPGGSCGQRALRYVVGMVFLGALYFGVSAAPLDGIAWRFVRYALVAFFASAVAPWLFVRFGLAQTETPAPARA